MMLAIRPAATEGRNLRVALNMIAEAGDAQVGDLVLERRSIRQFQPLAVPRALVADILRTALWAPSPHNVQPWRFTALFDDADKTRLADAMASRLEVDLRRDGLSDEAVERQLQRSRRRVSGAPVAILCSLVSEGLVTYGDARRTGLEWQMAVQSVGAVLQTIFLVAVSRGLGTCWMAAPMYCPEEVKQALALPDEYAPQALVLAGYAAAPGRVRERRPLDEILDIR